MATRKNSIPWDRIEIEYLAGEDSIRQIADRYEISDTAIRSRAKKEKWVRQVRNPARREPERSPPPPPPSRPGSKPEPGEIADNGRALAARMLDELDVVTSRRGELEDIIIAATDDDDDDARRDAMMKALSLRTRADTLKTIALAVKTLNEASAPKGKKAAQQERADEIASRFRPVGPPRLKSVK